MFSSAEEVLRFIAEENVEFVDVRFCDLPGTMQHFTVPVESFDEKVFTEGRMFDGSSIRGFQEIHESDMLLLPDPSSAVLDGPAFRHEQQSVLAEVWLTSAAGRDGGCFSNAGRRGWGARWWVGRRWRVRGVRGCGRGGAVSGRQGGYLGAMDLGEVVGHHQ